MPQTPYLLSDPLKRQSQHKFTLYWNHGSREVISGINVEEAYSRKGYTDKDVELLSHLYRGEVDYHQWDPVMRQWFPKPP